MIKGVNKSIIEIDPKGHSYFEKLIVILKDIPELPSDEEIKNCAILMLGKTPSSFRKRNSVLKMLLCGLLGAVITAGVLFLLYLFV